VQLREKALEGGELLARARRLVEIVREVRGEERAGLPAVVVNDRPDVALLAGADGVHLGQTDLPIAEVRRLAGFRLLVGVSTANLEQARAAVRGGADYCGVGPMFATRTKDKPVLSGPEYLRGYVGDPATSLRPHLAIGGITPENVGRLYEVGCRGIAVSAVVCGAEDPAGVCRALLGGA
jgi:thiamine-phosphate pyrophosphorylase